ncbi:MAG: hypothetical protein EOS07_35470, partial [Mesorhizobium sp.]
MASTKPGSALCSMSSAYRRSRHSGRNLPRRPIGRDGPPPASSRPSPSMSWPSAPTARSRGILPRPHLPPGKTLNSFTFDAVPMVSKAKVMAIAAGDGWLAKGANILLFGPPGGGKSHLAAAIGLALTTTAGGCCSPERPISSRSCRSPAANSSSKPPSTSSTSSILLILDDLAYVTKDQAETSVLFELISARYERRSIMIAANQPFGEWNRVFPDPSRIPLLLIGWCLMSQWLTVDMHSVDS